MSSISKNIEMALVSSGVILQEFNFPKYREHESLYNALAGLFKRIKLHEEVFHSEQGGIIQKYTIKTKSFGYNFQMILNDWFSSTYAPYTCIGIYIYGEFIDFFIKS